MSKKLNDVFNYPIRMITWNMWFILLFISPKYVKVEGFDNTIYIMKYKIYKSNLYIIDIFSIKKKKVDRKMH